MISSVLSIVSVLTFTILVFFAAAEVFLCFFVYNDAKEHSDIPALWVLVVIFVPNFIGLLLYFLLGRKQAVICPSCGARIQADSKFCAACGKETAGTERAGMSVRAKGWLIAFTVIMIISIVSIAALLAFAFIRTGNM